MVTTPEKVSRNGRPSISRCIIPDVTVKTVNVINQASGRFNHGNADHPTNVNSARTANTTNLSVSQWLQRKICRRKKCQT